MSDNSNKREIRFALVVDPDSKKVFIQDASEALQQGAEGAAAAGDAAKSSAYETLQLGKTIGQVWSSGMLLRLVGVGYAFKRIADQAKEPSPAFQQAKKDVDDLTGAMGTELQAAAGGFASAMHPAVQALTDANGGVHGLILGVGLFLVLGSRLKGILGTIGLAGGPWMAALAGGLALAGAAAGYYGEKAAQAEAGSRAFSSSLRNIKTDELQNKLRAVEARLEAVKGQINNTNWQFKEPSPNLVALNDQLETNIRLIKQELALRPLYNALPTPQAPEETPSSAISRINTEIALKEKKLLQGREEIQQILRKNQLDAASIKTGIFDRLDLESGAKVSLLTRQERDEREKIVAAYRDAISAATVQYGKDKDADAQLVAFRNADMVQTKALGELSDSIYANRLQGIESLKNAHTDLSTRGTEQAQKERSEATHRRELLAQIIDTMAQQGPIAELNALIHERDLLNQRKIKATAVERLEIDKQILDTEMQLTQARSAQAAKEGQILTDAQQIRKEQELANRAFAGTMMTGAAQLRGQNELAILQMRIRLLQQQAGLESASYEAIRRRSDLIDQQGSTAFGPPVLGPDQVKTQRDQLTELLGLLVQYRQKMVDVSRQAWQPFADAADSSTRNASRALAQMFTRGEAGLKDFAKNMEQTLEDLVAKLIENGIIALLASLFGIPLAGVGGFSGFWNGLFSSQSIPGGTGPRLPDIGNGGRSGSADFSGLERQIVSLRESVDKMASVKFRGVLIGKGSELRGIVHTADRQAERQKL